MEFRDYAATETSALLGRLLSAQADGAVRQLRQLREALDAAARAAESAAASAPQAEKDVQELARKLNSAASAELQRLQQEAKAALESARAEIKSHEAQHKKLTASITEAQAQQETLRAELRKESERAEAADRDLDATIEAHKQVDAARIEAEGAYRKEAAARSSAEGELREFRTLLESTRAEAARLSDQLEAEAAQNAILSADVVEMRGEREALTTQLDKVAADRKTLASKLETVTAEHTAMAGQVESAAAENRDLSTRLQGALSDGRALGATLDATTAENSTLHAKLDAAAAENSSLAARLDAESADRQAISAKLDAALSESKALAGTLDAAQSSQASMSAKLEASETEREALGTLLDATRARVHGLERDHAAGQETIKQLEARLANTMAADASSREKAASADDEIARARAEASAIAGRGDSLEALLRSSVRALDELGEARTIAELLAGLARQMATEFPRVAVFRVKGGHVEGEHQAGFDMSADVTKLMIPFNVDSLITKAATSGAIEQLSGSALAGSHAPFGGTPTAAIALPIIFQGETFAVLYAESDPAATGHGAVPDDARTGFATLLVRHTAVLLTRLSQEIKTLVELREYATMLLQEAEQMYSADVEAGKSEEERRRRLKETIECARQLYAQRAALEGPSAAALLDEQIATVAEAESPSPFAQELGTVSGHTPQRQQSRRTAS